MIICRGLSYNSSTASWPHYPNKNVFSDCRNWLYGKSASLRCGGKLFHSPGLAAAKALSTKVLWVWETTHVRLSVECSRRSRASETRKLHCSVHCSCAEIHQMQPNLEIWTKIWFGQIYHKWSDTGPDRAGAGMSLHHSNIYYQDINRSLLKKHRSWKVTSNCVDATLQSLNDLPQKPDDANIKYRTSELLNFSVSE